MGLVADYGSDPSDDEDEEYPDAGGKVVLRADVGDASDSDDSEAAPEPKRRRT